MNFEKKLASFTLVEVLVGIFIFSISFAGIFGAYYLGFKILGTLKNKILATAIAVGEMEKIKSLPYEKIGTLNAQLPNAKGILENSTTVFVNQVEFKIERKIIYVSDLADGIEEDPCNLDYKKVEIKVSFEKPRPDKVILSTDVSPKDKSEEIQSCFLQPGGVLSVLVFDAFGNLVPSPLIEVKDPKTLQTIASATPSSGRYDFLLASSTYKVLISKGQEYTKEETFGIEEIAHPQKPNPIVFENKLTSISFQIDKVSSFEVYTLSTWKEEFFSDSFLDESKISQKENVIVREGKVTLATSTEGYLPSGYLFSVEISPTNLIQWGSFYFTDEEPENTDLKYQVYFASNSEWVLIPDSDLPGNSLGFDESFVDLSKLSTTTYSSLKLKAIFSTNSTSQTPILKDWRLSFKTSNSVPIGNVKFSVQGEKLIGQDVNEQPVYKFSTTTQTDSQGKKIIQNLEWDNYTFSIPQETGLDLIFSDPQNPVSLLPSENKIVKLYLDSQNSLLVAVQDELSLEPIFSAEVKISKKDFQKIQYTDMKGYALFIPLEEGIYDVEVSAPGYFGKKIQVFVSNDTSMLIKLSQSE